MNKLNFEQAEAVWNLLSEAATILREQEPEQAELVSELAARCWQHYQKLGDAERIRWLAAAAADKAAFDRDRAQSRALFMKHAERA